MWIAAPLLIVSMAFVYRLERIRVGRAFIAIREDELAADAMGVNPTRYKVLAFALSAVLAGVAGAVSPHSYNKVQARHWVLVLAVRHLALPLLLGGPPLSGQLVGYPTPRPPRSEGCVREAETPQPPRLTAGPRGGPRGRSRTSGFSAISPPSTTS